MTNKKMVQRMSEQYQKLFQASPSAFFSSPGRLELLGNHTDHNHGKVLVAAVNLEITAGASKTMNHRILIDSVGFPRIDIDIEDLRVHKEEVGASAAIVRGVVAGFQKRGYSIGGFNAYMESTIFPGAGVSSSAAFELLICEILNYFYHQDLLDRVEMAKIGQEAETAFFGKPCGLLDQMGVSLGGVNFIDFISTEHPLYKHLTLTLKGYQIILTNTGGSHAGLTPYYTSIKEDMRHVAQYFKKDFLREVSETDFNKKHKELKSAFGQIALDRAMHFYKENDRVERAFSALEAHDVTTFLKMVKESGQSSRHYLKNISIGHPESEALSMGLDLSERLIHDGAVRVHGGGFAGTMLAFVSDLEAEDYLTEMKKRFGDANSLKVKARAEGVQVLKI